MKYQKGFTLIEIVIVIFLFAVLLLGMLSLFDWHNKVFFLEEADVRVTGSARNALNNMTKFIAQGSAVIDSRDINGTTYSTDSDTLVVQIPALSSGGGVVSNESDYIVYYIDGSSLYQIVETSANSVRPAATKKLSDTLASLSFTYNNADPTLASIVNIDLRTEASIRGGNQVSAHIQDLIFLRNR